MTPDDSASIPGVTRRLGTWTATLLVVASMIGTGVFTTTGFLIRDIGSPAAVLSCWLVGGVLALCGALIYGELAAALPRNGGEYQLLSRIYHPAAGFTAGWISLVVGFSAPIAASSIAFGHYAGAIIPGFSPTGAALTLLVLLSILHATHVTWGGRVQNAFTAVKVLLILALIAGGLLYGEPGRLAAGDTASVLRAAISPAFAVGLIFVSFSYSGWNGAVYLAGEVRTPSQTLPRALLAGTAIVILLYLGLNAAILSAAPKAELSGVVEVGHVAAVRLLGDGAGTAISGIIALALVSSVSAMMMAGPRVYQAMGEDYRLLSALNYRTRRGGPAVAVALQAIVAAIMILTATFETLLTYIGFTLSLCAGLTVIGVAVLRRREPDLERPYRAWGHPLTTALFVALSLWMAVHAILQRPAIALAGAATLAGGLGLYVLVEKTQRSN